MMASVFTKALLTGVGGAMIIPASLGLSGCSQNRGAGDVKDAISALHTSLVSIDGVEEAEVNGSSDGAPGRRLVNITLYLDNLSPQAVTPAVEQALAQTWEFDAYIPVGYSVQVWPAPVPVPPRDADTMVDLTATQAQLGLGGYVYNRQLFITAKELEAKLGARK